ncbi:hypothetical protein DFQ28_004423, partial [Apophysomyces sp. BC1034]
MGRITKRQRLARNRKRNKARNRFVPIVTEDQEISHVANANSEQNEHADVNDMTDYELLATFETVTDSQRKVESTSFPIQWSSKIPSSPRYWGTARTTKLYRQKSSEEMA